MNVTAKVKAAYGAANEDTRYTQHRVRMVLDELDPPEYASRAVTARDRERSEVVDDLKDLAAESIAGGLEVAKVLTSSDLLSAPSLPNADGAGADPIVPREDQ
jgi:hypothetical protein